MKIGLDGSRKAAEEALEALKFIELTAGYETESDKHIREAIVALESRWDFVEESETPN